MIVLVTMHQCFVHVHAIYFSTFFFVFFLNFFCQYMCIMFFVWAASYDGLMPLPAACHCNSLYVLSMLRTWQINSLSLTKTVQNSTLFICCVNIKNVSSSRVYNQLYTRLQSVNRPSRVHWLLGQLSLASLRGRLIEYQLRLG